MSLDTEQRLGGRYRLVEPIGYGGMGRVFRAHDELLDRAVAVKLLEGPALEADALGEARAAARLSHPGVVQVFDVGVSEGESQGYIVMELAEGLSLRDVLREGGKLRPGEAANLASQLADALEAIHRLGMVHCDVKPLNIIITPSAHTKLVDFGIARATDAVGDSVGSAAYVSPEQALGESVDARTDVYALGVVLYEMLTGSRPFSGENTSELVGQRLASAPPSPRSVDPRVPSDLAAIALRAMAREPAERYPSAAEMRDALNSAISRASAPTRRMAPIRRPLPFSSLPMSRRMVAIGAALVVCVVAALGWRIAHPAGSGVPRLVGLQLSEVPPALEQAGMAPGDITVLTRPGPRQYVGIVVDQQPQPGLPREADNGLQIAIGVAQ